MCTRAALRAPPLRLPALRALPPLMLIMRPQPAVFMNGMTAREQRSAPTYFVLKSCSKSSSMTVSIGPVAVAEPPGADPLFTRMCRPPNCCAASATMRSTCSLLVTSAASGTMRRFVSADSSRAVASRSPLLRATIATSTPSRANSRAMALPIPRLPPVTIACLPCNPRSMAFSPADVPTAICLARSRLSAHPVRQVGGAADEVERPGEIERVVERVEMVEVRRLRELHEGQPVTRIVGIEQVAGEGQELAPVVRLPVVVERIELLQPLSRAVGAERRLARGDADLA